MGTSGISVSQRPAASENLVWDGGAPEVWLENKKAWPGIRPKKIIARGINIDSTVMFE